MNQNYRWLKHVLKIRQNEQLHKCFSRKTRQSQEWAIFYKLKSHNASANFRAQPFQTNIKQWWCTSEIKFFSIKKKWRFWFAKARPLVSTLVFSPPTFSTPETLKVWLPKQRMQNGWPVPLAVLSSFSPAPPHPALVPFYTAIDVFLTWYPQ